MRFFWFVLLVGVFFFFLSSTSGKIRYVDFRLVLFTSFWVSVCRYIHAKGNSVAAQVVELDAVAVEHVTKNTAAVDAWYVPRGSWPLGVVGPGLHGALGVSQFGR